MSGEKAEDSVPVDLWTPLWARGVEETRIVRRLFLRAAERLGSASALARSLGLTYPDIRRYLNGEAIPSEEVLLRTVTLVMDDLEVLKAEFSAQAWSSLSLPGTGAS